MSRTLDLPRTGAAVLLAAVATAGVAAPAEAAKPATHGRHAAGSGSVSRIPLSTLVGKPGGMFPSGAFDFRWAARVSPGILGRTPTPDQILLHGSATQTCRSIHLDFAAGGQAQSAGLVLTRKGRPTVSKYSISDTRGSLDATLRPGHPWVLAASTPADSISVFVNGWATCSSSRGVATGG